MSQDYPPFDDDQETRRRSNTPLVPAQRQPPPVQQPMARPVFPQTERTAPHGRPDNPLPPEPESSGLYVPWWGFVLVILAVAGVTCGLWAVVLATRGDAATAIGPTPSPIFVIITASATLGPGGGPLVVTSTPPQIGPTPLAGGATSTPGPGPTAAPVSQATPTQGIPITLGATIVISGTEGDGLTVRQGPGKDFTSVFVAKDGDRFTIKDGPRQANGYIWWYIVDPNDQNRFGWAVADFMQVTQ